MYGSLHKYKALLFLVGVELLLFVTNYQVGTYLIGWDNLFPEFNFPLNLSRSIFGVWQDYKGVGMPDGMSTIANLFHTLFLWILSFIIPQSFLRYSFFFLMHLLGMIGMYVLLTYLMKGWHGNIKRKAPKDTKVPKASSLWLFWNIWTLWHLLEGQGPNPFSPLFGALFYGLSLGTIQLFYAPLEGFAVHFATLPFFVLTLLSFLNRPTQKKLLLFSLVTLLQTPSFFIPQLFFSTSLLFGSICVWFLLIHHWHQKARDLTLFLCILFFLLNGFWLLPYGYSAIHNSTTIYSSHINELSSPTIYQLNHNRGSLPDVLLLKGFMLDTAEYFPSGQFTYSMLVWRNHSSSILFVLPALVFAFLCIGGVVFAIKKKTTILFPFLFCFAVSFFFLGNNIPLLDSLNNIFRTLFPLLGEAFRFPFTKFETLFIFCYSIFLTYGLQQLLMIQRKHFSFISSKLKGYLAICLFVYLFTCLFVYCLPVFQGNFFYDQLRLPLSSDYQQTMAYFKDRDPTQKVLVLPQLSFWNWQYHTDGYRGSGFLWYGIPQALMDRSFDPWSKFNENFYWELSYAVEKDDPHLFATVLQKYNIGYVLWDTNITYPSQESMLWRMPGESFLTQAGLVKKQGFGKIHIYKEATPPVVAATSNLPMINSYSYNNNDVAYQQHGTYVSSSSNLSTYYPFRSLFTYRTTSDTPQILENFQTFSLHTAIPSSQSTLTLPKYATSENFLAATLSLQTNPNHTTTLFLTTQPPTISTNEKILWNPTQNLALLTFPTLPRLPLLIAINGVMTTSLTRLNTPTPPIFLTLSQNNSFTISDTTSITTSLSIPSRLFEDALQQTTLSLPNHTTSLTVSFPKIRSPYFSSLTSLENSPVVNCSALKKGKITTSFSEANRLITAVDTDACLSLLYPYLPTNEGYILSIDAKNDSGLPFTFWADDISRGYGFAQNRLSENTPNYLILPTREGYNLGYSFHFDSVSSDTTAATNQLQSLAVYPFAYSFLTHMHTGQPTSPPAFLHPVTTRHPNQSLYVVSNVPANQTLILAQSYDSGWKAYVVAATNQPTSFQQALWEAFPFFFGKELTSHLMVNNWENGWTTSTRQTIILVFLPQYLEYGGFLLTIIGIVSTFLHKKFFSQDIVQIWHE